MIGYKFLNKNMETYNNFKWEIGKWYETDGEGKLCSKSFFHAYEQPLLAVLHNPIHGDYDLKTARLFKVECEGVVKKDGQMKLGASRMRLLEEIEIPVITIVQRIIYGILCAKEVYEDKKWNKWADGWLNNIDRTARAAMEAAWAANIDLVKLAEMSLDY